MATRVRSYSKVNLGLVIGPVRGDGFHGLATCYQTLDLHDVVRVTARRAEKTKITLTTNHPFVPRDGRNTAWKMVERCLLKLDTCAEVEVYIEKNLPVQGGMGAGSANAAAALIGLERELGLKLSGNWTEADRLAVAAEVGSDVPLFLIGGAVLGEGRGEIVRAMPDMPVVPCVVAVPGVGVSTPAAFRDWDSLVDAGARRGDLAIQPMSQRRDMGHPNSSPGPTWGLTSGVGMGRLEELSHAYSSVLALAGVDEKLEASGILRSRPSGEGQYPEKKQGLETSGSLAENALLALVRTGIGSDRLRGLELQEGLHNDFEDVVFPEYPSLRETKRQLMGSDSGSPALYAALSGSGSALFGLYGSVADAVAAQQRVQATGVQAFLTETLPRREYWTRMFAG